MRYVPGGKTPADRKAPQCYNRRRLAEPSRDRHRRTGHLRPNLGETSFLPEGEPHDVHHQHQTRRHNFSKSARSSSSTTRWSSSSTTRWTTSAAELLRTPLDRLLKHKHAGHAGCSRLCVGEEADRPGAGASTPAPGTTAPRHREEVRRPSCQPERPQSETLSPPTVTELVTCLLTSTFPPMDSAVSPLAHTWDTTQRRGPTSSEPRPLFHGGGPPPQVRCF